MTYYFIISLPFLFFFTRLLWTNFIIPHAKKKSLTHQMKERADSSQIESTLNRLKKLFEGEHPNLSILYQNLRPMKNKELIYGEIDFLSFHNILEKAKPKPHEIFYDLGSGAGKAVFSAALFFNLSKSCGIELLPSLYKRANKTLEKAIKLGYQQKPTIQLFNDSFLHYDFREADIIYVAATCLNEATWESLIEKMLELKSGSRLIVATKSIQHKNFKIIYQGIDLMSWGLCPVTIYKIQCTPHFDSVQK